MVHLKAFILATVGLRLVSAAPLQKRIDQIISDSTALWQAACTKAGGGSQCGTIAETAFTTLLAAGANCDQQNSADAMVSLAKTLNNDPEMIRLAQLFVQQPRNAPDSLSVPYCQTAPKNAELNGFFHCEFAGSNLAKFSGDQTGNLPLGLTAVTPPGSCPANPSGPIADGVQLNTLVTSPGTPETGSGAAAAAAPPPAAAAASAPAAVAAATTAPPPAAAAAAGAGVKPFTAANGKDAQALNVKFQSLTAGSPCTDGEQACVGGGFAQCVGGKFSITPCSGGTQCFALPLVNKPGTSVTCDTAGDAAARIAATGNTGGVTGSG